MRTALLAVAAAVVTLLAVATDAHDPSGMPTPPWWVGVLASLVAAVVALAPRTAGQRVLLARCGFAAATVMAVAAAARVPHSTLWLFSWVLQQLTDADPLFETAMPWLLSLGHLLMLAAAVGVLRLARVDRRAALGRCRRCGRVDAVPPVARLRPLRWLALGAAVAPVPYAALKAAWGLGSRVGVKDPDLFEGVTFFTPGFGDTVLLALIGIAAAAAMAVPVRHRVGRALAGAVGVLGSAMLLPVGIIGGGMIVQVFVGAREFTDDGLAMWVFTVVYGSFLAWGACLSAATLRYLSATRPGCVQHVFEPVQNMVYTPDQGIEHVQH